MLYFHVAPTRPAQPQKRLLRIISAALFTLLIAGCGGLDSSNTSSGSNSYAVQGSAVKGPLAHAGVAAYLLDPSFDDLKGELVALGLTDAEANLDLNIPAADANRGPFLLEFTGGSELGGSTPVISVLRTILSSDQLASGTPVFATPLTTFVLEHSKQIADLTASVSNPLRIGLEGDGDGQVSLQEFMQAITVSSELAKESLGLGLLPARIDLFTTSPLLDGSAAAMDTLALRTANEVVAALVVEMDDEIFAAAGTSPGGASILRALARDFADGIFDKTNDGNALPVLSNVSDLDATLALDPVQLTIPGTSTPIADIAGLIVAEANAMALPSSGEPLLPQSPEPVQTSIYDTGAGTGEPDPEPAPEPEPDPAPVNTAPTVLINNPQANSTFSFDQIVSATLLVSDAEDNLSHCDVALDGNFVARLQTSPYTANLGVPSEGGHTLTATCVDSDGLAASAQQQFAVSPEPNVDPEPENLAPVVSITAPGNNSAHAFGANISVSATASDSDGSVSFCDLTVDGGFVARDSAAPFLFSGASLNTLASGAHSLTVACSDQLGLGAETAVNITIDAPPEPENVAPSASFVLPALAQSYTEGDPIHVRIDASDSDGNIAHCTLSVNGNSVRQESFAPYDWGTFSDIADAALIDLPAGEHQLLGICVDDDSDSVSIARRFTVIEAPNVAPSVSITSPAQDQHFNLGESISVAFSAADSDGSIASCELQLDGELFASDSSAPFNFEGGALASLAPGSHTLQATCTDDDGLTSTPVQHAIVIDAVTTTTSSVALDWIIPTTREDGAALTAAEIDSYEIYYYIGSASQNGTTVNVTSTDQGGSLVSSYVIEELASGNYFFTIATIDTDGNVSAFVNPIALNIP